MRVRGWYERRVLLDPSANPWGWSAAHEVAVSADLLLGGDLLQRATEQVYCEAHVRTLALTLVRAVETLREAGVLRVDLAPWTLLYPSSTSWQVERGGMHRGLTLTNACLGCHHRAPTAHHERHRRAPSRAAFDAPEVRHGQQPRSATSAMYTLGCLLHLFFVGEMPDEVDDASEAHPLWAHISADARALVAGLLRRDPASRLRPAELLEFGWLTSDEPPSPSADAAADADAGGAAAAVLSPAAHLLGGGGGSPVADASAGGVAAERRLLVEAHEALNEWYDGFLFEDAAERLAWMGEQARALTSLQSSIHENISLLSI